MKIIDNALLDQFRGPGRCEKCLFLVAAREPHHIICRGAGGGKRLDVSENIVALGGSFQCGCHDRAQANKPGYRFYDMLELVRFRLNDGRTVEELEEYLYKLQKKDKHDFTKTVLS